jgi:hypothetical protein
MRFEQLLEPEHQARALERRGVAPRRERSFRSGDGGIDFSSACGWHASRHPALRRIEYVGESPARASGALTIDEMRQPAHGTLIFFAHDFSPNRQIRSGFNALSFA